MLKGLLGVAPIYWTVCTIEVFTYAPMLGSGGTYLAFVTGNITNLKAPAAINSMEAAKVKPGSEEGEVISTIAIATTSIVTTIIPVSYTHLDVYKRQASASVFAWRSRSGCSQGSFSPGAGLKSSM